MSSVIVAEPLPVVEPALETDDNRYEIIDGRRVELPPMSLYANWISFEIASEIRSFAKANNLGIALTEALFHLALTIDRNRRPDVAFVSYERWPKERGISLRVNAWDVVPDLAIEVVSPTDLVEELMEKLEEYFQAGVRLVWVIYPKQRLLFIYDSLTTVRGLTHTDEVDGGAVLPGFRLSLASLFPKVKEEGA